MTTLPLIVSICGPSAAGKSQLAKVVAEAIGMDRCERITADYFLDLPASRADDAEPAYYAFDWELLNIALRQPPGTVVTTPDFDFARLVRRAPVGGLPFTVRPIVVTDGFAPHPHARVLVRLDAGGDLRRERLIARDRRWGSRVIDRWTALEATWAAVDAAGIAWDLRLSGERPLAENAAIVAASVLRADGGRLERAEGEHRG